MRNWLIYAPSTASSQNNPTPSLAALNKLLDRVVLDLCAARVLLGRARQLNWRLKVSNRSRLKDSRLKEGIQTTLFNAITHQNAPRFVEPGAASRPALNHKPPSIGMPRIKMPCVKYGVSIYGTKVQRDRTKK